MSLPIHSEHNICIVYERTQEYLTGNKEFYRLPKNILYIKNIKNIYKITEFTVCHSLVQLSSLFNLCS